jgi:hypothetical protein
MLLPSFIVRARARFVKRNTITLAQYQTFSARPGRISKHTSLADRFALLGPAAREQYHQLRHFNIAESELPF